MLTRKAATTTHATTITQSYSSLLCCYSVNSCELAPDAVFYFHLANGLSVQLIDSVRFPSVLVSLNPRVNLWRYYPTSHCISSNPSTARLITDIY